MPVWFVSLLVSTAIGFFVVGGMYQQHISICGVKTLLKTDAYIVLSRDVIFSKLALFENGNNTRPPSLLDHTHDMHYNETSALSRLGKIFKELSPLILSDLLYIEERDPPSVSTGLIDIMKYGFPGIDDVHVYDNFVISYNRRNREAHWVCEHLRAECLDENTEMHCTEDSIPIAIDNEIPSNYRASLDDYDGKNYEPCQLAAESNYRSNVEFHRNTFRLTNTIPVHKELRNNMWRRMEDYVRELTKNAGSVYVYSGPMFVPRRIDYRNWIMHYKVLGANTMAVPTHFFKVLIVESKNELPYMQGYAIPNAPIDEGSSLNDFICQISDIEHFAGLKFFDGIERREHNFHNGPQLTLFKNDVERKLNGKSNVSDKFRDLLIAPLYGLFKFLFIVRTSRCDASNLFDLIKYGLPGIEDVHVHKDYIVSHDARTNGVYWVCEHFVRDYKKKTKAAKCPNLHFNDVHLLARCGANVGRAFKSKVWHELELYISELSEKYGSVYAYSGPLYLPVCKNGNWILEYQVIDWVPVPVPSHYFKVLIIDSQLSHCSPYMEGYIVPNKLSSCVTDLRKYLSDIDEIERYSGLKFVSGLRHSVLFKNENYVDSTTKLMDKSDKYNKLAKKMESINCSKANDY